ncbi:MAG: hypothetical protein WAT39_11095, partial [Planctomycetota bacterium]
LGLPQPADPVDAAALRARDLADRGQGKAALRELEPVLRSSPVPVDALRLRQDLLRERGRRGLLLSEAEAAVKERPDDGIAQYLYGRVVRDVKAKLAAFERAAELLPQSAWPWLGLAHTLRASDRERSAAIYEQLFAASGSHPVVGTAWAATLRDAGDLDAAARIYTQLRGDTRARDVAELALARLALARENRAAAWASLQQALRGRPFDTGVQALVLAWLEAGASDDQAAQLLDVLREDGVRLRDFASGQGVVPAVLLLQRSGQLLAARTLLDAAATDPRDVLPRRLRRRALLALGDVRAFLDQLRADVPLAVVDHEPNRVRGRWLTLLRGPWYSGDPLAAGTPAVELLRALRDVGLLAETELLAELVVRSCPDVVEAARAVRDEVRAEIAFESGLRRVLYRGYQEQDTADLATVLGRLRELSVRVFGRDVVGHPQCFQAPLVGEMMDPFAGALAGHLDRYNKHLVLGRRSGGVAEGLLLTRLSLAELPESAELALPGRCLEVIGIDRDVRSLGGVAGGDLAGVALLNHFLIDFDAVREWADGIADRRRVAAEDGGALVADALPADPGEDPFDVAWRLSLLSPVQDSELDLAVLDTIRHHERQHLVDSFHYLPVEQNLWRGLGLLLEFAFSPSAIEAEMERRAELASLVVSPHTELVLAHIADFMADAGVSSPHHQGFGELGRELTAALAAAGVPAADCVPSRWHLVPPAT